MLLRSALTTSIIYVLLGGCGTSREVDPKTPNSPAPGPSPSPGGSDFSEVTEITDGSCKRCHSTSQFLKSEAAWDASEAKERLTARTMPPAGTNEAKNLSDADRAFLIAF